MKIYDARTSKLVSEFLSLKPSLVTNSAQLGSSTKLSLLAGPKWRLKTVQGTKKSETSFEVLA